MMEEFEGNVLLTEQLLLWYQDHARDLPWRKDTDPYHVWVSEIMLQQTRVEAVKPYYHRFLAALPDISSLADCPEDRLLKLWEGLGYYSRAKNLKAAAQRIIERCDGVFPAEYQTILSLPGIGPYTAGAIASIAFGKRVCAIDGNVMRVISRLTGSEREIGGRTAKAFVEEVLDQLMPDTEPGTFNQALMELGAMLCLPNGEPKCAECPWKGSCAALETGRTQELPVKAKKKARLIERKTILVLQDGIHGAFRKRASKGLLAGLYELPSLSEHVSQEEALRAVRDMGLEPVQIHDLPAAKHIFTHIEWQMIGYQILVVDLLQANAEEHLLLERPEFIRDEIPIPRAFSAYTRYFLSGSKA